MQISYKHICKITIPVLVSLLMEYLIGFTDTAYLGRVGETELAASALAGTYYMIIYMIGFGFSIGAQILIARYNGSRQYSLTGEVFTQGTIFLLLVATLLFTLSYLYSPVVLSFLIDSEQVYLATISYLNWRIYGFFFSFIIVMFRAFFIGTVNTKILTINSIVMVLTNIILNYILIFGKLGFPAMGVVGAAIATVISRFVECGYLVVYTHTHVKEYPFIKNCYRTLRLPMSLAKKILITGTPLMLNEFLWAGGLTLQTQAFSTRGLATIGGLNICNTLGNISNSIFVTLGTTIAIVVGQLLGAGKLKDAKVTATRMATFSFLISLGTAVILFILGPIFPLFYNTTGEIRQLATRFIWVVALATPFISFTNSEYFILRSGGKTIITFLFDSCFVCLVNVPVSMCLAKFTSMNIVSMFLLVNMLEGIKSFIGFVMVKKDIWLNTIVE